MSSSVSGFQVKTNYFTTKKMRQFALLLIVFLGILGFISCEWSNDDQLIFTHVIFRHGDRNPLIPYPNDPFKDEQTYWPEGFGQLTKLGKKRLYDLGKFFRKRYHTLIGNGTNLNDVVYVQSTNKDRTLASAASNLAGFFPPKKDETWQPISIHTVIEEWEIPCQRYDYAYQKYLNSSEYKALYKKFQPLFNYLEEHSGLPMKTFGAAEYLYSTLRIENQHNLSLPEWTKQVFVPGGDFEWAAGFGHKIRTATTEMARLRFGFLVREILDRFSAKINSTLIPDRTIWIYSGHDATLAGILDTLQLFKIHSPPYAASVLFELYKSKANKYYVQIFYKNSSDEHLEPLYIPSCGEKCPIEKLRSLYKAVIPVKTLEEECQLTKSEINEESDSGRHR